MTNIGKLQITGIHLFWLGLFVFCTVLQLAGLSDAWRYDRRLVSDHQWWLLFSGQLVHLDWGHWLLNMSGIGIVVFFFSSYGRLWHWLTVFVVSASFVGAGVQLWNPEVITFVGLSGVLHGLFIYGAIREIDRYPLSGYVLLTILIGKLAYEFFVGAMPFSEAMSGGTVITDSHLYGGIGGIAAWLLIELVRKVAAR